MIEVKVTMCLCGDKEVINRYGHNPHCRIHSHVEKDDYERLKAERDEYRDVLVKLSKLNLADLIIDQHKVLEVLAKWEGKQ
jgi:predicted nucleic acid-binding Zn finger protein